MASGRLADYLGKGDAADRPASLALHPEAVGFYYATDTEEWSAWDGSQWVPVVAGGVPDPVPEISGSTAGNAALESLLQALENAGIIVNNTTP